MHSMTILLDDAVEGRILRFRHPDRIIIAHTPSEVKAALAELEAARANGRYLAGWFAYELGYVLEPRLAPCLWKRRPVPLLWFGAFSAPETLSRKDLASTGGAYAGPLRPDWDEAAYRARFERVKTYIVSGDVYQVNLSFRAQFAFAGDPWTLYLALRDAAETRHGAYVDMGESQVLSASPELFFRIFPDGRIVVRPMKGTAPRGCDAETDALAVRSLAASEKNRAENLMIVDLLRNDLSRIAEPGSVSVSELFAVETYPTLHTMVSTVAAQLRQRPRIESILQALFPCGSITGAPKIRAMEIIRELETDPRGVYCGAIGHIAPDGTAVFNVAIRTVFIEDGRGTLGLGGAVVHDSIAKDEYAECLLKAQFFERIRRPIALIETLRWDGEFVRLDLHLERMMRSATWLGLPFNRATALKLLHSTVGASARPLRVRLLLNEDGQFECTADPLDLQPQCWTFAVSSRRVDSRDLLLRHKTTWREFFDDERKRLSRNSGVDEVLFLNERGELTEGSRTNIFVRRGDCLLTPPLASGLLNGVLRRVLLEEGRCREAVLTSDDLEAADEIFFGNSLRGLVPASRLCYRP